MQLHVDLSPDSEICSQPGLIVTGAFHVKGRLSTLFSKLLPRTETWPRSTRAAKSVISNTVIVRYDSIGG